MMASTKRQAARLFCCAIAAATIFSAPALAVGDDGILIEGADQQIAVKSILVATADLDLATAQGNRALEDRVARAARKVCGESYVDQLEDVGDYFSCRDETMAEARRDIARLTAVRSAALTQTASR